MFLGGQGSIYTMTKFKYNQHLFIYGSYAKCRVLRLMEENKRRIWKILKSRPIKMHLVLSMQ